MRGEVTLSNGVKVRCWAEGDKLYAEYVWGFATHRHDCESIEAEKGKPLVLSLVTGSKLLLCKGKKGPWGDPAAPTVERIVCSSSTMEPYEASGCWLTTQWERQVDPANAS